MRVGLVAAEEVGKKEKGNKSHTHAGYKNTAPAAFVCDKSDIHTTVTVSVISAYDFSW